MTLSSEEVWTLTGYRKPSCQIRQLKSYGLRFFIAADGHPRVLRSDVETRIKAPRAREPNFSALDQLRR
ncbi:MAG: DUF4224 domain-containing protein [Firmicutes bacterium]|nr:DUF4224 domain-containing protein [Bacillota bacterium]